MTPGPAETPCGRSLRLNGFVLGSQVWSEKKSQPDRLSVITCRGREEELGYWVASAHAVALVRTCVDVPRVGVRIIAYVERGADVDAETVWSAWAEFAES